MGPYMGADSDPIPGVSFFDVPLGLPQDPAVHAALERISARVGEGISLDEVLDFVWGETAQVLPHDRIGLAFVEEDGARVACRWFRADYEAVAVGAGYSEGLAGSSLQKVLETGRARIIHDLQAYIERKPDSPSTAALLKEGVRSNLTLPLKVGERPVGFLFFSSRRPWAFTEPHARILLAVRDRIAQAVEKAWLIKRLSESKEAYFSMLGFIAHELKGPLASISARAESYVGGYAGPVDPKAEESLRGIVKIAGYMNGMVRDYLDLTRLETGEMRFVPKPGVRFVKETLQYAVESAMFWAQQRKSKVVLDVPKQEILLEADPDLLRILMANLVDNAVKYGFDNIEVRVSARVEGGSLVATVRNPGVGFSEEQAAQLFKRFSRLKQRGTEDRKGTGLGLYLCWYIAQKHGGRLSAASQPGQWAEFTLKLPNARLENGADLVE